MSPFQWTPEQEEVLASQSRITLVEAGPGSGKTKLFVELMNRHLETWGTQRGGIAALSFTNVASDEIAGRLGGEPSGPHFVGTLDSFFLRFVVGPFGHLAGVTRKGARLIPSPLDEELKSPTVNIARPGDRPSPVPLFRIEAYGGPETSPTFVHKPFYGGQAVEVPNAVSALVFRAKKIEWASRGRITHGDSHFLAALILNGIHAEAVRKILARRFPLILIDEFQDTGYYLGRAIRSALSEPTITAVVVGDKDQGIYHFSGADARLFERVRDLEGCDVYPLRTTQRCSVCVSGVAGSLTRSGEPVEAKENADTGAAVLVVYSDEDIGEPTRLLESAAEICGPHQTDSLAVLVRKRKEKTAFTGSNDLASCPLSGRGPKSLQKAVNLLTDGRGDQAARIVESLLGHILFESESPNREDLELAGFEATEFRGLAKRLVLHAAEYVDGETWGDWSDRMKVLLNQTAAILGGVDFSRRLGGAFRRGNRDTPDKLRERQVGGTGSPPGSVAHVVLTVHQAKGLEFDAVLFHCPKPSRAGGLATCPSENWWSDDPSSEEKEVAFVAVTRAQRLFILSVHEESYLALSNMVPDFVALFDPIIRLGQDANQAGVEC